MKQLKLSIPNIKNIEILIIDAMKFFIANLGINNDVIDELKILVTEAVINALEHSKELDKNIDVIFNVYKDKIAIIIKDYGHGFDPSIIEDPKIEEKFNNESKRGWGLKLLKTLSDRLEIESSADGTKITVIKNIN